MEIFVKTSYRTVLFGAVMFVCAAAPVLADSEPAVPGPVKTKTVVVQQAPTSNVSTVKAPVQTPPKTGPVTITGAQSLTATLAAFSRIFGLSI